MHQYRAMEHVIFPASWLKTARPRGVRQYWVTRSRLMSVIATRSDSPGNKSKELIIDTSLGRAGFGGALPGDGLEWFRSGNRR